MKYPAYNASKLTRRVREQKRFSHRMHHCKLLYAISEKLALWHIYKVIRRAAKKGYDRVYFGGLSERLQHILQDEGHYEVYYVDKKCHAVRWVF